MARRDRSDQPGSWHHVVNRGIAKRALFEDRIDIRYFLSRLAREVRRGRLEVHAFSLLTTHYHLLVRSPRGELSEAMRRAQNEYSRAFNRRHRRDGTLIRGRFLSKPVESNEYRWNVLRYIDHNPVRAGLAGAAWQYPWCSASQYVHTRGPARMERAWVEEEVRSAARVDEFDSAAYVAVLGPAPPAGACRLVDERLSGATTGPDELDHLIRSAPPTVRAWMERKARLADGAPLGMPVCDGDSVRGAIRALRASLGSWQLAPRRCRQDGWALAEAALLRSLAGFSIQRVATATDASVSKVRRRLALHGDCMDRDEEYRRRMGELGVLALSRCHGRGESA